MSDLLDSASAPAQTNVPSTSTNVPMDVPEFLKSANLEPEYLNEPAIKNMKDLPSLVKSYLHAQKMVGADKVVIPGKNATPEQWNEVYNKLGLPKKEEYKINKGEKAVLGDEFYTKAAELGHEMGILPHQMQGFISKLEADAAAKVTNQQKLVEQAQTESINNLKKEWGDAFEAKIFNAKEVLEKFGDDETKAYIRESGLGNEPKIVKFLAKIGSSLKEARVIDGKADAGTPADLQSHLDGILKDKNHPYWNKDHIGHAAAAKEVEQLFAKLHN